MRYVIVQTKQITDKTPPIIDPWSCEKVFLFDFLSRLVVNVYTDVENRSTFLRNLNEGIFINYIKLL